MGGTRTTVLRQEAHRITTRPGVYLYYDRAGSVIYVGKAKNLRNRVRQYLARKDALGAKTPLLVSEIARIETIPTDSEFDALLLEASLIRRYQPKWNSVSRDDKSPLFIVIPFDEQLPRIRFMRKRELTPNPQWAVFGPFPSARMTHLLMRSIRRIIPYCTQKTRNGRPCFYTQLGLCDPCPNAISDDPERARVYRNNLRRIASLLSGGARRLRSELEKSMRDAAKREAFEQAREFQRQLAALERLLLRPFGSAVPEGASARAERVKDLSRVLGLPTLRRIECIDVSHIHGKWASGSLVVFTEGEPDTDQYRRFRIRLRGKPNDVGMMAEVISRRFAHPEWPYPDLLVVDGGKPQLTAAKSAPVPVAALAKRFEEIILPAGEGFRVLRLPRASPALQLVEHIRDEAHRFAKRYHIVLRSRYV